MSSLPHVPTRALTLAGKRYEEIKDPCLVHDGERWHLYGTGVTARDRFEVLHATATTLGAQWRVEPPIALAPTLEGGCLAAPGVIADGGTLHMFLQTDFNLFDGRIEHLCSSDGGNSFAHLSPALRALPGTAEAGIYDPHPARVAGQLYLTYSAFATVGMPDVHLARSLSATWDGPWERLGPILCHEQVPFHNARDCEDYEWGLEGAQLVELPCGRVLLVAVCFLAGGVAGNRQRVFLAAGDDARGPFEPIGPLTVGYTGENGHASAAVVGDAVAIVMQERDGENSAWRYGIGYVDVAVLERTRERQRA
jgi:hypothetical protein